MPVNSMTAFSRCEESFKKIKLYVEIKSLNNRYLDIKINQPSVYNPFHHKISKLINSTFSRGGFEIFIKRDVISDDYLEISFNKIQAQKTYELLELIRKTFKIKNEIQISDLLNFNLINQNNSLSDENLNFEWSCLEKVLEEAFSGIKSMRRVEGEALFKDIKNRLLNIKTILNSIDNEFDASISKHEEKVLERLNKTIKSISKSHPIDADDPRFLLECGYISEKSDITEEIIRLRSHIEEFEKLEAESVSVGRKMDFFMQEMNREVNTISSKNIDLNFSQRILEMKSEIEKIRQQVQNIE